MLDCNIISALHDLKVSAQFLQGIIAIDAIMGSTKTKAKDFLDNSNSFEERVTKKCMRLKMFQNEIYVNKLIVVINKLNAIDSNIQSIILLDVQTVLDEFGYWEY